MTKAFVLINCETGKEESILSQLRLIDSVKEACGTFGTFDLMAKLQDSTEDKISKDISQKIRKISQIKSTLTLHADEKIPFDKTLSDNEKEVLKDYMAHAYVIIGCKKAAEKQVLSNLSKIPEVIEGDIVVGSYDIMCKTTAPTYNEISEVVTKKIRNLDDIDSTVTLNVIP